MEHYPAPQHTVSQFSCFSPAEFDLVLESITRRYGQDVLAYCIDEQRIDEMVSEKATTSEKIEVTAYWVKEAVREYHYRAIDKQFR
jgi:hypothetical protein